jgi:uncharacterized YigZ family protein
MVEKEEIITIKAISESKYKEKGSQFIGLAYPIENMDDFSKIHSKIKKKYFDASHHCYAFRLVSGDFKYSDAGEPNGSAGIRILNAIDHFELTNVLVLVVRYFGGTKLGVGPLGKAYYNSAELALESAEKVKKTALQKVFIKADFSLSSLIHKIIADFEIKIIDIKFTENVNFVCLVKPGSLVKLEHYLQEKSSGSVVISSENEINYL